MLMAWYLICHLTVRVNVAEVGSKTIHESGAGNAQNPRCPHRGIGIGTMIVKEEQGAGAERDAPVEMGDSNSLFVQVWDAVS
jgi:hypothetical protein